MSTTIVQLGTPDGEPTNTSNLAPEGANLSSIRAGSGAVSYSGGEARSIDPTARLNTAELGNGEAGILSTARTSWGSPRSAAQLQPTDLITVEGQEMQIQVAERIGLIQKGADGRYSEIAQAPQEAAPQGQDKGGDYTKEGSEEGLADPAAERLVAEICGSVMPGTQVSFVNQIVDRGEIHPNTINRAASEAGIDPSVMSAQVARVVESFNDQADRAVKALGSDDPAHFYEWVQKERPQEFREAMRKHAMERTTQQYGELYRQFVGDIANSDPWSIVEADFGNSGITARMADGKVLLSIPGVQGELPYRAALEAGLIRVQGA